MNYDCGAICSRVYPFTKSRTRVHAHDQICQHPFHNIIQSWHFVSIWFTEMSQSWHFVSIWLAKMSQSWHFVSIWLTKMSQLWHLYAFGLQKCHNRGIL